MSSPAAALAIESITLPTDNLTLCHLSVTDHAMPTTLALHLVTAVQATLRKQLVWLVSHKDWELGDSEVI